MTPEKISFSDAIIQMILEIAPSFLVIIVFLLILSWVRVLADSMSGRGW